MSSDDLTQQLAEVIDVAFGTNYTESVDAAQAILAFGLVVPTSAVNAVLDEHGVSETPGRCVCGFWLVTDMSEHILAMLRALIRQETP
jgi:hypothetical protein